MEDYNLTNIDEDKDPFDWWAFYKGVVILVASVGLPLISLAIYTLYKEVREDHVAPVYLINLLVSDLIQMCSSAGMLLNKRSIAGDIFIFTYYGSLFASVGFMVCISVERYLMVAFPLWYRFRRNIRNSVIVSLLVWILTVITATFGFVIVRPINIIIFMVFLLLPFPVLIFSLVGTLKALLASVAVGRKKRQKIVTVLVVVLLNYTVLFLPFIIWMLKLLKWEHKENHFVVSRILLQLSPLVDLLLYVFMRRGTLTKLQLTLRCCRKTAASQLSPTIAENQAEEEEGEAGGAGEGAEPR